MTRGQLKQLIKEVIKETQAVSEYWGHGRPICKICGKSAGQHTVYIGDWGGKNWRSGEADGHDYQPLRGFNEPSSEEAKKLGLKWIPDKDQEKDFDLKFYKKLAKLRGVELPSVLINRFKNPQLNTSTKKKLK